MPQVMVPLDGSEFSEQALKYAYDLAGRMRARLHLVKVQAPEPVNAEGFFFNMQANPPSFGADEGYLTVKRLDRLGSNVDVVTAVLKGRIVDALSGYIHDQGIDLIIMTTHGRGGLSRAWLGSVADQLVRRVNIPTLLLRPSKKSEGSNGRRFELDHIVIPLDGSAESERAIEPAIALGQVTGAHYTLLQVVPPLVLVPAIDGAPIALDRDEHQDLRTSAAKYLDGVAERLREQGHQVDTAIVIQPQCAAGILEQAAGSDANLIAMATHGRSGFQRLALGSVADKVLRGTTVPLLLLRPWNQEAALSASA
jgi:nucleotide-binding universal stress UspA family protein